MSPTFDVPIVNVTVVRGQIALLPCSIDFLGKYKVIRTLVASANITHIPRIYTAVHNKRDRLYFTVTNRNRVLYNYLSREVMY